MSQAADSAVLFNGHGAPGANVFQAFFDGGLGFRTDLVRVVQFRQIVGNIR
jgi:hypothetical protein